MSARWFLIILLFSGNFILDGCISNNKKNILPAIIQTQSANLSQITNTININNFFITPLFIQTKSPTITIINNITPSLLPTSTPSSMPTIMPTKIETDTQDNNCIIRDGSWIGESVVSVDYVIRILVSFSLVSCEIHDLTFMFWESPGQYEYNVKGQFIQVNYNHFSYKDVRNIMNLNMEYPYSRIIGTFNSQKSCFGTITMTQGYLDNQFPYDGFIIKWNAMREE